MSNALAIAGVTATLQYCLNLVYNNSNSVLGAVSLSAQAPDIVQTSFASGANSPLHVNLFLHQVAPNVGWRNVGLPSVAADGSTQLHSPPLALDLHYPLTAYASEDTQAEALLGFAVLMLHENAILARSQIRTALGNLPSTNPLAGVLNSSGLADQIEMIKITPSTLGREEMAWLWTALKADYRPTYCFQVSLVLIESQLPISVALPVLSRTVSAQVGPPPQLLQVQPPSGQAPAPGDSVTVIGQSLSGSSQAALVNQRLGIERSGIALVTVTDTSVSFTVPDDPANLPAGVYNLSVVFTNGGTSVSNSTNSVPMPVAPVILTTPAPTAVTNTSGVLVTISCKPQVLPNQSVALILGSTSVSAVSFDSPTATLSFQFPALAAGPYLARLLVDGVESPVGVNWGSDSEERRLRYQSPTPPTFTGPFVTVT